MTSVPAEPLADVADWEVVDTGPVSLHAPHAAPRQLDGTHGHMWQWVGDGRPLLSLSVAVRETRMGTPRGALGHLGREVEQIRDGLDEPTRASTDREVAVRVQGARGSSAAVVVGARDGLAVRDAVVVTTDGDHLHVVRVGVLDNDAGRAVVDRVLDDVRVHPWSRPR